MCLEFTIQRFLELKFILDIVPAVFQRVELEEVVGMIDCESVKLRPGEGDVDVLCSLGAVHYEHTSDGLVDWSVQGNLKLSVISSDGQGGPLLTAQSWNIMQS